MFVPGAEMDKELREMIERPLSALVRSNKQVSQLFDGMPWVTLLVGVGAWVVVIRNALEQRAADKAAIQATIAESWARNETAPPLRVVPNLRGSQIPVIPGRPGVSHPAYEADNAAPPAPSNGHVDEQRAAILRDIARETSIG